jgi:hypothetical protein
MGTRGDARAEGLRLDMTGGAPGSTSSPLPAWRTAGRLPSCASPCSQPAGLHATWLSELRPTLQHFSESSRSKLLSLAKYVYSSPSHRKHAWQQGRARGGPAARLRARVWRSGPCEQRSEADCSAGREQGSGEVLGLSLSQSGDRGPRQTRRRTHAAATPPLSLFAARAQGRDPGPQALLRGLQP